MISRSLRSLSNILLIGDAEGLVSASGVALIHTRICRGHGESAWLGLSIHVCVFVCKLRLMLVHLLQAGCCQSGISLFLGLLVVHGCDLLHLLRLHLLQIRLFRILCHIITDKQQIIVAPL